MEERHRRHWRPGLGPTVGLLVGGMVLITATVMLVISNYGARVSALEVSESLVLQVARRTQDRVQRYLSTPYDALKLGQLQAEAGVLPVTDLDNTEGWFYDFMLVYDDVAAVYYGDRAHEFIMVKRVADGALSTKRVRHVDGAQATTWRHRAPGTGLNEIQREEYDPDDHYDPHEREWYKGTVKARGAFWTPVYIFWTDKQPGVTASLPVYDDNDDGGALRGVLSLDISLADFSAFLAGLKVSERGRAVVLDAQGRVVAGIKSPGDAESERLPPMAASGVAELMALDGLPEVQEALEQGHERTLRYSVEDEIWLGVLSPIRVGSDNSWVIAVVAPEQDFLVGVARAVEQSRIALLIFVLLALGMSAVLTRWLTRSLDVLVAQTARVRDLHLEQTPDIDAPFREIEEVLQAFEGMKTGLRSFQKYVPIKLVRRLLVEKKEPELGGELMEVTLYFSDIAGFTPISEALGARQMAIRLGAYHSAMTRCIQDREGTVVQYVGDEIMAFWGAPSPVEDPAGAAADAALSAQRIVENLWAAEPEIPVFSTRMGLHTATVAVGHFGSTERLYYGAIGDGVNLCSRLEGANKLYGTKIIVSETARSQLGDRFECRRLDHVAVKGKQEAYWIYELLGRSGDVDARVLESMKHYDRGLELYLQRRWQEAGARFQTALALRPGDRASALLIERCEAYKAAPPPEDWGGIYAIPHK